MRTGVMILAAGAAIALAGCGGSSGGPGHAAASAKSNDRLTTAALVAQLKTAVAHAQSVHIHGAVQDSGSSESVNLSMTRSGQISGSVESAGTTLDLIDANKTVYIKVTSVFLKLAQAPAGICAKECGKYVAASASDSQQLTGDLSLSKLLGKFGQSMPKFTKAAPATINGQQVLTLKAADGSVLYVAATGVPYPLRITGPSAGSTGQIDFSQWNAVPAVTAPPASQVVDLSKLGG